MAFHQGSGNRHCGRRDRLRSGARSVPHRNDFKISIVQVVTDDGHLFEAQLTLKGSDRAVASGRGRQGFSQAT